MLVQEKERLIIQGGKELFGEIPISGSKNTVIASMPIALLTDKEVNFSGVPDLGDVSTMLDIMQINGIKTEANLQRHNGLNKYNVKLISQDVGDFSKASHLLSKIRASVLFLGPMLAKYGEAKIAMPGGCAIGERPVDLHIANLEKMGADIKIEDDVIIGKVNSKSRRLRGCIIDMPFVSVGATENTIMAATLAEGVTVIKNAAYEPEIIALCGYLQAMGAKIAGVGTRELVIEGVKSLDGADLIVPADRIEAGTYAVAVGMTSGEVLLTGINIEIFAPIAKELDRAGVSLTATANGVLVRRNNKDSLNPLNITTKPFPDFPTDMQAQFMAMACLAEGESIIIDEVFPKRFLHVDELRKMGARIQMHGNKAIIDGLGKIKLQGSKLKATDLRASVALVLAGLVGEGESQITDIYHLDRGYEHLEDKLSACGASIERVSQGRGNSSLEIFNRDNQLVAVQDDSFLDNQLAEIKETRFFERAMTAKKIARGGS